MGDMGVYQMYGPAGGSEESYGGVFKKPDSIPTNLPKPGRKLRNTPAN